MESWWTCKKVFASMLSFYRSFFSLSTGFMFPNHYAQKNKIYYAMIANCKSSNHMNSFSKAPSRLFYQGWYSRYNNLLLLKQMFAQITWDNQLYFQMISHLSMVHKTRVCIKLNELYINKDILWLLLYICSSGLKNVIFMY